MRGCHTSLADADPVLAFNLDAPEKGSHFWHFHGLHKPVDTDPAFPIHRAAPTFWASCTGATHLGELEHRRESALSLQYSETRYSAQRQKL